MLWGDTRIMSGYCPARARRSGIQILPDRNELDAGFHEGRDEGPVSGQPIEFGDNEPGFVLAGGVDGARQFRAGGLLAALDSTNSPTSSHAPLR
jgi:hypothetical protein